MIGPFFEAIRATSQPCTFLLIVPMVIGVVAVRARWTAVAAAVAAFVVGGWLLAANWFVLDGAWLRASALLALVALVVAATGTRRGAPDWIDGEGARAAVAGGVALLATLWWRPCVGEELGAILTGAQTGLAGQLPAMAAYMIGAALPAIALGLAAVLWTPPARIADAAAAASAVSGVVVTGALLLGRHDDVVVTLTRWTLS